MGLNLPGFYERQFDAQWAYRFKSGYVIPLEAGISGSFLWLVLTLKILNHPLAMFIPSKPCGRLVLAIRLIPTLETFNWHWLPLCGRAIKDLSYTLT